MGTEMASQKTSKLESPALHSRRNHKARRLPCLVEFEKQAQDARFSLGLNDQIARHTALIHKQQRRLIVQVGQCLFVL